MQVRILPFPFIIKMKTIKELEIESKNRHADKPLYKIHIKVLKDVLELIDETSIMMAIAAIRILDSPTT